MANLSELTRKQQVLVYLQARTGLWVDGPELANERVGGSEGLKRLRELRQDDGYDIRARKHPDPQRDIWQYRLVPGRLTAEQRAGNLAWSNDPAPTRQLPVENAVQPVLLSEAAEDAKPAYPTRAEREPPDPPAPPVSPWPADHDQTRISTAVRRKEDGTFEYVPPQQPLTEPEQLTTPEDPPQPPGYAFERLPKSGSIVYGEVAVCPRCHGRTTRGRPPKPVDEETLRKREMMQRRRKLNADDDTGSKLIDADGVLLFRDPSSKKPLPCKRCNGYGIVPNAGPIPLTPP